MIIPNSQMKDFRIKPLKNAPPHSTKVSGQTRKTVVAIFANSNNGERDFLESINQSCGFIYMNMIVVIYCNLTP